MVVESKSEFHFAGFRDLRFKMLHEGSDKGLSFWDMS
jgi:hypothetical protein